MEPEQLYNCCIDCAEPDWSQFHSLALVPMLDHNGESSEAEKGEEPDFWSIIGCTHQGDFEPITDCTTEWMARCVIGYLSERSHLPVVNH